MSLFVSKGLPTRPSRLSRASLARTSISGTTRAQASYTFHTTLVIGEFPIRCHNPLNVGLDAQSIRRQGLLGCTNDIVHIRREGSRTLHGSRAAGGAVMRHRERQPPLCISARQR